MVNAFGMGVGDTVGATVTDGRDVCTSEPEFGVEDTGAYQRHASIDTIPNTMNRSARFIGALYQIGIILSVLWWTLFCVREALAQTTPTYTYWFSLARDIQVEVLYFGLPGEIHGSFPIGIYRVKTGIPDKRPTPVPQLIGRPYWLITKKYPTENPETAPYFLELDVPVSDGPPYGPVPYPECGGACDWVLPGAFGLHGVNGDLKKLSVENPGSSGCIRHTDQDIRALYELLDPEKQEVRYYVH